MPRTIVAASPPTRSHTRPTAFHARVLPGWPALGNQFDDDESLRTTLERLLPPDAHADAAPGLRTLGARAVGDLSALGDQAEHEPPRHVAYDAWGRRVDRIEVSPAWRELERVAAREGLVARGYDRPYGSYSRLEQFARLYLFHPSTATASCPLAMTDGAARRLALHGPNEPTLREAFARLTSRDPQHFWTSGQWMTERAGGSDVGGTSTVAHCEGDIWRLRGTKWFTSATTAPMALTLARVERDGVSQLGSAGLSLFYVETHDASGALRGIVVHRLKEKLGTRALPTAELTLHDTSATLVGGEGNGVRKVAAMLNITRLYNAVCAAATMRRATALATDYARRRVAFGKRLIEHPLHAETLASMATESDGALQLVAHLALLLGRDECGEASDDQRAMLRVLTPVAKLFTGKQAVRVASEGLEAFGGAGYIEDTGLPRMLRDAQVLSIWEGTTNVLALDVLRALAQGDALEALARDVEWRVGAVLRPELVASASRVRVALRATIDHARAVTERRDDDAAQAGARRFAFALARVVTGSLLLEHAMWSLARGPAPRAVAAARRWCAGDLAPLFEASAERRAEAHAMLR